MQTIKTLLATPRIRHGVIALTVAIVAAFLTILRPLDVTLWSLQSKIFKHEASGDIVLVVDDAHAARSSIEAANRLLVDALEQLDEVGVELTVIDTPLRKSSDRVTDARLHQAIKDMTGRVVIAVPVDRDIDENASRRSNAHSFQNIAPKASTDLLTDFLNFVWRIEPSVGSGDEHIPATWAVLASEADHQHAIFPDYAIDATALPQVQISALADGDKAALNLVRGKRILIGPLSGDERTLQAPDSQTGKVNSAHIHAIAAETAIKGRGWMFASEVMIAAFGALLLLIVCVLSGRRTRRIAYALWAALFIAAFAASAILGHRVMLADPMLAAIVFAVMRFTANYRQRHLYVDAQSRLPNFAAFRKHLDEQGQIGEHVLVIAKVARLDAIFATLKTSEKGEYLRQVASRLALGEASANVYHDGGKYLGMVFRRSDYADLQGHLEGLRAVASQAVMVGDTPIDVAITIGVDQSNEGDVSNRISSAIAAADQAREAYRPVFIISDFQADSEEWDHSLQSRLENALSENRISVKLQPKIDMQSGLFVGAEALARWTDQQRGEIPPVRFIIQCERAGRLDDLTKRVMEKSMRASMELDQRKLPSKVSVNVSAIQFVDNRIIDLVEMALNATGADPRNLMIEITETARVENLMRARSIMEQIKAMGITFSIDDFGVGSGNLDALYQLPFDEIKIDRMFSNEVARCARARAVVTAMLDVARSFEMRSVVEGIDELSTLELLRDMGGDLAQGFCIARPQTLPLLIETLRLQAHQSIVRRS
ncbi:MAG: EAL domain-containing protein [Pseudomonadota bacterium]